ncbi:MAG: CHAT domain-containing tetratricopeptide repeat protein [bacterium]
MQLKSISSIVAVLAMVIGTAAQERLVEATTHLEREIKPSEIESYTLPLAARNYFRLLVEQRSANVALTLLGPDGSKLADVNVQKFRQGIERLYWIAGAPGNYKLEVRSLEKFVTGKYEIRLEAVREATQQDKFQIQALQAFWDALDAEHQGAEESTQKAIEKYENAAKLFREANDAQGEAAALHRIAVLYPKDQAQKALEHIDRAITLYQAAADQQGEASALAVKGKLYTDTEKALEQYNRALPIARAAEDKEVEARVLYNMARLYQGKRDWRKAIELYQLSLAPRIAAGDSKFTAYTLNNLGMAYFDSGEPYPALDLFGRALAIIKTVDDRESEAGYLHNLAMDLYSVGDVQKALDTLDQAIAIVPANKLVLVEVQTLNLRGQIFGSLGEYERAIASYQQGLALVRQLGIKFGERVILLNMGDTYSRAGDYQKAIDAFQQASLIKMDARPMDPWVTVQLADTYLKSGKAEKALELVQQALPLFADNEKREKCVTYEILGRTYLSLNEPGNAMSTFNEASTKCVDVIDDIALLLDIAHAQKVAGNLVDAQKKTEVALAKIESYRSRLINPELRASYFSTQQEAYYFYVDLLMTLHKQQPTAGFDRLALEASEARRARSFLESLIEARTNIRQGVDPKLIEQELTLGQRINAKQQFRLRLLSGSHTDEQVASVDKEVAALVAEYQATQDRIRKASPRYAALTQPQNRASNEIQQLLAPNTLLLEYSLGEERSYVWAVTNDSVSAYELPPRQEIDKATKNLYGLLTARQPKRGETEQQYLARVKEADAQYHRQAAALSRVVLDPVARLLETKRLLIVADDSLAYVPFAALPSPMSSESASPLVADHEIVYLPSASTLAVLRQEIAGRSSAPRAVAVFADPVFDKRDDRVSKQFTIPASENQQASHAGMAEQALRDAGLLEEGVPLARLPFSRQEAEGIAALTPSDSTLKALGFKANLATALSPEVSRYRIVHFATHALVNPERPYLSGLLLSLVDEQGRPQNGFLSLSDIYNLHLPADLIVLSACQTAIGKEVKGEGIIGLTRGFMYAGAPRVMATLWKVDDAATAEMVKRFYRALLVEKLPPAAALQAAQLQMSKHRLWSSPYYWAGFVLQGEPN